MNGGYENARREVSHGIENAGHSVPAKPFTARWLTREIPCAGQYRYRDRSWENPASMRPLAIIRVVLTGGTQP